MAGLDQIPTYQDSLLFFIDSLRSRIFSSQVKAARHFGLSHTTVSRYENGVLTPPLGYIASLAMLLVERLDEADKLQQALLSEINQAIRFHYPDDRAIENWAELQAIAADYQATQTGSPKESPVGPATEIRTKSFPGPIQSWGEAPDVQSFFGREAELSTLSAWLINDRCRLVGLLGIGGIGKTTLATRLAQQLKAQFDYLVWRSLRNGPWLQDILGDVLGCLSGQPISEIPDRLDQRFLLLVEELRRKRCLLVLDNAEAILQAGEKAGHYREGYEAYGQLLQLAGETDHQSCLLLTSREKPREFVQMSAEAGPVRLFFLEQLGQVECQAMLENKGLAGDETAWRSLIDRYSGNPLALKLVAETIRELFDGDVAQFLAETVPIFGGVRDLLTQQFERLSPLAQTVLYWLAIERKAVSLAELQANMVQPVPRQKLQEALIGLRRHSLLEHSEAGFTLQNVVLEYVTQHLTGQVCAEVESGAISILARHALIKAEAEDHIRESQLRAILQPIADQLSADLGRKQIENRITQLLAAARGAPRQQPGYLGGNLLNLLVQLEIDLSPYDFSGLPVWQGYLRGVNLSHVNFAGANLGRSVFTETFDNVLTIAFSPDGSALAGGTANGEVRLWRTLDGKPRLTCIGHADWVWSVALSPDGQLLASGSADQTIRIWEVETGRPLEILSGHTGQVMSVAFRPDGRLIASGSDDRAIRLWDPTSGECVQTLTGHTHWVGTLAFDPTGRFLASGSDDRTIRLWDVETGACVTVLAGHSQTVWSVAFSPDGARLASGSSDHDVRIWDVASGHCLNRLTGHGDWVLAVDFSPDGQTIASGSDDRTVRLWDISTGKCRQTLSGHTNRVWTVAFNPAGRLLASGSDDQTVKLWDVQGDSGQSIRTLQGHTNWVSSIAFSPDGRYLASGSDDQKLWLWEVESGDCIKTMLGHVNWVWAVDFSPDGQILASGGDDKTVKLWQPTTGHCFKTLEGHQDWVRSVAFSPDGRLLASGSADQTIRLWEVNSGRCLEILRGHTHRVMAVRFDAAGTLLASGSNDHTVRLWDVRTGQCLRTLAGHTNRVKSVAFSPAGQLLASASADRTIRIWETGTGNLRTALQGHTDRVWSVSFSPDGRTVASGGCDRTVRLWDVETGACLRVLTGHTDWLKVVAFSPDGRLLASGSHDETIRIWETDAGRLQKILRTPRPYEGMNITGATGLTDSQKGTLLALGAVDEGLVRQGGGKDGAEA